MIPVPTTKPITLAQQVCNVAKLFVGQKETGNNTGFADPAFQKEMLESGFYKGAPWCSFFVETVFRIALEQAGRDALWQNLEPLFSPGAVDTLNRFRKAGYTIKQIPSPGDLVVWRFGPGPSGHIGIVIEVGNNKMFTTVEGNTTGDRSTKIYRDSDQVAMKPRRYGLAVSNKPGAFNLLGFVSPV